MPTSCYIDLGEARVHYLLTGSGHRLIIAFHGYGLDAASLQVLADSLAPGFMFASIDLPHHGQTLWGDTPLTRHRLVALVREIAARHRVTRFTLAGYSLGGRICMTITELVPELVEQLVLIAPDGLVFNLAYYLATHNFAGRQLFRNILKRPGSFFKLADWLAKRKLISASKHKFVTQYLETHAAREMLGKVWHGTGELIPEHRKLKQQIAAYRIPVFLYMGKFDTVIPVEHAVRFSRDLPGVHLEVLQKGHKILDTQTAALIAAQLMKS